MPERLDWITVTTSRGPVALHWDSREELLAEIDQLGYAAGIVKAFTDVGASRLAELSDADRELLLALIEAWSHKVGVDALPAGVWDLRCAIAES